ncbi:MAG: DUF4143 domain-containing protein [Coxiellaceae bacterium]|nr:DUF4143 domain-containing protein [Coxiellaceae bacterium]
MKRFLEAALLEWVQSDDRLPIVLRGARQVGKTHLVETFGRQHFKRTASLNLEKNPEYMKCFSTFSPNDIIHKISLVLGEPIIPGETLLFIDEIQQCPEAIQALRYFKEDMPHLHVIAAGSLLEFALNAPDFKMPVGRVQYLYLKPVSFLEYLTAKDKTIWIDEIKKATMDNPIPDVLHSQLLQEVRNYITLGGMPAVVEKYIQSEGVQDFQRIQMGILETYMDDFSKYASRATENHIKTVFDQMPLLMGQQTKYSKIDPNVSSKVLKQAINCLVLAGVVYQVYATAASGTPINALVNHKKYKLFFLDVGLMSAKSGLSADVLMSDDIMTVDRGQMAEQFVCQELLAYESYYQRAELFYWQRENKSSKAEVDFVGQYGADIVPIEVKAGSIGRLKSIQLMMTEKKLAHGFRVSQLPLSEDIKSKIINVPLYMVSELGRLIQHIEF